MKKIITIIQLLGLLGFFIFLSACDEFSPHTMIQLTFQDEIHARSPVWSPEGDKIVFYGSTEENWGLWTMDPQGNNFDLLLYGYDIGPPPYQLIPNDFSYDSYLLFSDDLDNIYYLPLAGGDPVFVCEGSSPTVKGNLDGIYNIAYLDSNGKGPGDSGGIYLTDIHGSESQLLVSNAISPHWSPDGSKIVFTKQDEQKLCVMDMNTSETTIIYEDKVDCPRWSPDGRWIAFCDFEVYIIPSRGGSPIQLTEYPYDPGYDLPWTSCVSWSPDGKWIVYDLVGGEIWKVYVE